MKLPKKINKAHLEAARQRLFELKEVQAEARKEAVEIREWVADQLHDEAEGSKTVTVQGIKVTVSRPLTRTITAEDAERLSQDHPDISEEVLVWKPSVKVGEYKKHADICDDYITTKPGLVTVEFK